MSQLAAKKQKTPDKISIIVSPANLQEGGLFIGDSDSILDEKLMHRMHVTAVVSIVSEYEIEIPNVTHLQVRVPDEPEADLYTYFIRIFGFISKHRKQGNVLVHCMKGVSRSPTIVVGYLMVSRQISMDKAMYIVQTSRPSVRPNPGFLSQLRRLEASLSKLELYTKRKDEDPILGTLAISK